MPNHHRRGARAGGGSSGSHQPPQQHRWPPGYFVSTVPMPISALVAELGVLTGSFKFTFMNGEHAHVEGPFGDAERRGLREECEDMMAEAPAPLVVRRRLLQPDAAGFDVYHRSYIIMHNGCLRLSPGANRESQTSDGLGDEPGVKYE